jgi:hypothetical protein
VPAVIQAVQHRHFRLCRMIHKSQVADHWEGSDHGLIEVISQSFPGWKEKNHDK